MTDFHAHILPKADHGSDSISTSIKQILSAKKAGITTIIATPHYYNNSDNIQDFIIRRENSYNNLVSALKEHNIEMNIIKASEVNLQVDLFDIEDLRPLCIEGTNYMLLEMPLNVNWTNWHYDAIDELIARGIEPIIAHVNRYSSYYMNRLFEKDVLFQVNIEAFKDFSSRYKTVKLFKKGLIDIVASDVHKFSIELYDDYKKYSKKYPEIFKTSELTAVRVLKMRKTANEI